MSRKLPILRPSSHDGKPNEYPCDRWGTSKYVAHSDGLRLDCDLTKGTGGCYWQNQVPPDAEALPGTFDTSCSLNIDYANALLALLCREASLEPPLDFMGPSGAEDDDGVTDRRSCEQLLRWIRTHGSGFTLIVESLDIAPDEKTSLLARWRYLEWWLTFVAIHGDGYTVWP